MIGLVCWCDEEDLIVLMKAKPYLYQNGEILINIEKAKRKTKKEKRKVPSDEKLIQCQWNYMTRKQNLREHI